MKKDDDDQSMHRIAKEAVDVQVLARILEAAGGEDCEDEAAEALREVVADDIVWYALATATYARRRGQILSPQDIGNVADNRCGCCCGHQQSGPLYHLNPQPFMKFDT